MCPYIASEASFELDMGAFERGHDEGLAQAWVRDGGIAAVDGMNLCKMTTPNWLSRLQELLGPVTRVWPACEGLAETIRVNVARQA